MTEILIFSAITIVTIIICYYIGNVYLGTLKATLIKKVASTILGFSYVATVILFILTCIETYKIIN